MNNLRQKFFKFIQNPQLVFLALVIPTGVASAILVPQLSVNDETSHYLRSYNISRGEFRAVDCTYPKVVNERVIDVHEKSDYSTDFSDTINENDNVRARCDSAATYTPILHMPQAIGINIANLIQPSTGMTILMGRIVSLFFYALSLYILIKHVKIGKWVFVVIALFPYMVHTAASLSGDTLNNVAVLGIIALTLNLFVQKNHINKKQIALLISLSALLVSTKIVNIFFLIPLIFLPASLFTVSTNHPYFSRNIKKWAVLISIGIVSILVLFLWRSLLGASAADPIVQSSNPVSRNPFYFINILFNTYISPTVGYTNFLVQGMVGSFSSFKYHTPLYMLLVSFILLFISLIRRNPHEDKLTKLSLNKLIVANILSGLLFVAIVTYGLYVAWALNSSLGDTAYYAEGVQGRYFTAALGLLIPLGIWVRRYISVDTRSEKHFSFIMFIGLASTLAFYVFQTYWTFK